MATPAALGTHAARSVRKVGPYSSPMLKNLAYNWLVSTRLPEDSRSASGAGMAVLVDDDIHFPAQCTAWARASIDSSPLVMSKREEYPRLRVHATTRSLRLSSTSGCRNIAAMEPAKLKDGVCKRAAVSERADSASASLNGLLNCVHLGHLCCEHAAVRMLR
eukprot:scaffold11155_cov141-Isochrysis_galbana.AAC.5